MHRINSLAHDWLRNVTLAPVPLTAAAENRVDELQLLTQQVRQLRADALEIGRKDSVDRHAAEIARRFRIELDAVLIHLATMTAHAEERLREVGGVK